MKKITLLAAAALMTAAAAHADGYDINFSGVLKTWYQLATATATNKADYKAYLYISPDIATRLDGNQLTSIGMSAVLQTSTTLEGSVFVSEDIAGDPVTSVDITVESSSTTSPTPQVTELETPYTIKAGQGFYIGYTVNQCQAKDYPLGVGNTDANAYAGAVDVTQGGKTSTVSMSEIGYNLYITATTVGEKTELLDLAEMTSCSFATYTLPTYEAGSTPKISYTVANLGTNKIETMMVGVSVNGSEDVITETEPAIAVDRSAMCSYKVTEGLQPGYNYVKLSILSINGQPVEISKQLYCLLVAADDLRDRMFVVEKGTGTWCGYCPIGIVGFEAMEALYPETFIPVEVHVGDAFAASTYNPISSLYFGNVPAAIINRDPNFVVSPSTATLKSQYNKWLTGNRAAASISATGKYDEANKVIKATATFDFAYDEADADHYAVAFVVLEDGLTGRQTNYYAGAAGAPGDWGSKASSVTWTYDDVARSIQDCFGIAGSVPASIEKGKSYTFDYDVALTNVKNINNTHMVAYLLDTNSGVILNAATVTSKEISGVGNVAANHGACRVAGAKGVITLDGQYSSAKIYNAAGALVGKANGSASVKMAPGLYLVNVDGVTTKVIVK